MRWVGVTHTLTLTLNAGERDLTMVTVSWPRERGFICTTLPRFASEGSRPEAQTFPERKGRALGAREFLGL